MSKKGFTLIEVMVVVAIVGILASIAIPSVVRFQARAKQAEAKANLKALFTAQKSWYGERDAYITDGSMLGFAPELNNRYAYDLGGSDCWARPGLGGAAYNCVTNDTERYPPLLRPSNLFPLLPMMIGVSGTCPQCQFAGAAAGNIDDDQQFDEWFVSSVDGTSIGWGGGCGPEMAFPTAGVPFNAQNDVSCDPP